jgi:hypothetical protein
LGSAISATLLWRCVRASVSAFGGLRGGCFAGLGVILLGGVTAEKYKPDKYDNYDSGGQANEKSD